MSYYSSPQEPQQFELFNSSDEPSGKKGLFSQKVSLAIEHLMIAGVVVLVLCVVVFSIGVERGKQTVIKKADDLEINLANSGNDDIIPPSSEAVQPVSVGKLADYNRPAQTGQVMPAVVSNQEIVVDVPVPVEKRVQQQATAGVTGTFTVQVASFKQAKFASQEVETLKKRGYEAYSVSKGGFYLVCVGRYKNSTQAEKTSKALKSKYKDNVIRRL